MPIASGTKGRPGVLAVPALESRLSRSQPFRSPPFSTKAFTITGVTRDSAGAALAGVTVQLFRTADDFYLAETISDGSGNYSFGATAGPYYIVAYKAGVPDVAGTTVNTLTGA